MIPKQKNGFFAPVIGHSRCNDRACAGSAKEGEVMENKVRKQRQESGQQQGIDRLIALLTKASSGEIDSITQAGNSKDSISIIFKDGEVLVLTAESEVVENPDSTNFV